jgi:hypothetical protein
MDPIVKKEKQPLRRISTSSGDVTATKKKSSRACAPCRKRKVKKNKKSETFPFHLLTSSTKKGEM